MRSYWYRVVRNEQSNNGEPAVTVSYDVWSYSPSAACDHLAGQRVNGHDGKHQEWQTLKAYKLRKQPGADHYPGVVPPSRVVVIGVAVSGR